MCTLLIPRRAVVRPSANGLPPSPDYLRRPEVYPENLRRGITQDLTVVEDVWRFRTDGSTQSLDPRLIQTD
jgi:hypothetical protein